MSSGVVMRSRPLSIGALLLGLACVSPPGTQLEPVGPRGDSKTVTVADLADATQLNLLDYIAAERPQWLRTPDGRQAAVIVYVDEARLGGPSTLRGITLSTITGVRFYEASAAQQRFSLRDRGPVIHVMTK
jgi:hypothetical protein